MGGGGASRDCPHKCGKNVEKTHNKFIKNSKNAHITNNECTKTAKCAKRVGSMRDFEKERNIKVNTMSRLRTQNKILTILSTLVLLFAVATIMFCTLGGLSARKTAVGSITFDFKSPSMNFNSGLEMYYSNLDASGTKLDTPKLTFGKSTGVGADTIAPYYMSFSSNQTGVRDYYVKLIYQFDGLDASKIQSINMGTSALAFGAKYMSAPTLVSGSTYKFESVSVAGASSLTHDKISAGQTFDLLQFMRNLSITFTEEEYSATSLNFSITTIVDLGDSFASSHKAQAVISGKVGYENYFVKDIAILSDNLDGATYQIFSVSCMDHSLSDDEKTKFDTTDGKDAIFTTTQSMKWKIEIQEINFNNSSQPFYNKTYTSTIVDDKGNSWLATLTTRNNTYISMSFESINEIAIGKINLLTLLTNSVAVVPSQYNSTYSSSLANVGYHGGRDTDLKNTIVTYLKFYGNNEIQENLTTSINWCIWCQDQGGAAM